jgi:hypothetical protein
MKDSKQNYILISRVALLFGWTAAQTDAVKAVLAFVDHLKATRGDTDTVSYLKEAHRISVQALAGYPCTSSLRTRIGVDKFGFPKLLPRVLRKPLYSESVQEARLILVLLSIYREIVIPGKLKLDTIVNPPSVDVHGWMHWHGWSGLTHDFVRKLEVFGFKKGQLSDIKWKGFHITNRAGPNGRAMVYAHHDAWALTESPLWDTFQEIVRLTGSQPVPAYESKWQKLMRQLDTSPATLLSLILRFAKIAEACFYPKGRNWAKQNLFLGRVSAKIEAAGKVRVFAMPDYWTQTLLKPLHEYLFEILRCIPTDSTFDQAAGIRRATVASRTVKEFWSFDLSAATDRFPIDLQVKLLEKLFCGRANPERFAQLWKSLLTSRGYQLSASVLELMTPTERKHITGVRYGCGQPMGAYSSWAMFALSHHCLVQAAAIEAGYQGTWYMCYQLLGDDIVFWGDDEIHAQVADKYLAYCEAIGVTINVSKSPLSSNGLFEFAKALVKRGEALTPFHWKEWDRAFATPGAFNDFIKLMRWRGFEVTPSRAIATWLAHRNIELDGRPKLWTRAFGSMPGLLPQLAILLFSPIGAYPTTVEQWSKVLQLSLSSLGGIDVAWPDYPREALGHRALPEDRQVILYDPLIRKIRSAFWEIWEQEGSSIASRLADTEGRRRAFIRDLLDKYLKVGLLPPERVIEAYSNVSLIARETATVYRKLWRSGLSFAYGPLAAGGMTDLSGDDLELSPSEILKERSARQQRPLEDYLKSPSPEAKVISFPTLDIDELSEKISFASKMVMKCFKRLNTIIAGFGDEAWAASSDTEGARQATFEEILAESKGWVHPDDRPDASGKRRSDYFQPVDPAVPEAKPFTSGDSFVLYRAAYGKWPWETEAQTPPVAKLKGTPQARIPSGRRSRAFCGDYDD